MFNMEKLNTNRFVVTCEYFFNGHFTEYTEAFTYLDEMKAFWDESVNRKGAYMVILWAKSPMTGNWKLMKEWKKRIEN